MGQDTRLVGAEDIAVAAQLACLLEASAPKPGNVSPGRDFADARYEDFLASAAAIGGALARAGTCSVGATVREAVEATARWTSSNTNLGIVLLLTPLARATSLQLSLSDTTDTVRLKPDTTKDGPCGFDGESPVVGLASASNRPHPFPVGSGFSRTSPAFNRTSPAFNRTLRDALRILLDETTIDDARDVYAAIRQAAPGGLGRAEAQDVKDDPTITLVDVMRLAADRDGIAREYATAFETTFEIGVPTLAQARRDQLSWNDAIVETFLTLLARAPDTHITRRGGAALAAEVSSRARNVLEEGGVRSTSGQRAIAEMDRALRDADHLANPGTTADLTAASIFVVLLGDGWRIR